MTSLVEVVAALVTAGFSIRLVDHNVIVDWHGDAEPEGSTAHLEVLAANKDLLVCVLKYGADSCDLEHVRAALMAEWSCIPDQPPADQVDELVRRADALVWLIGWIDCNQDATRAEYLAQLSRVRRDSEVAA